MSGLVIPTVLFVVPLAAFCLLRLWHDMRGDR